MRFDRSQKRNKVSRRRHVPNPDTGMDSGAQSVPTAPFYVASSCRVMLHGPRARGGRARGMIKLCDYSCSGDTFWNHGGVARAEQGTGGKSTGRDWGFVYKVGNRGQNIDEVYTFFEEACMGV